MADHASAGKCLLKVQQGTASDVGKQQGSGIKYDTGKCHSAKAGRCNPKVSFKPFPCHPCKTYKWATVAILLAHPYTQAADAFKLFGARDTPPLSSYVSAKGVNKPKWAK